MIRNLVLLAIAAMPLTCNALAVDELNVATDKGKVQGKMSDDGRVRVFLGIPFAAPPVGALRWRPPVPPARWKQTLQAQSFGHRCMQPAVNSDMVFHDPGQSEDCLTLNVWAPPAAGGARLPVMVWIYGGGFQTGGTSERRQEGAEFARKGVILVSMNYRLNIFGFFTHPALAAESPEHAAGNYGLMDQAAALQWVKRNIAAFGGDPENITLFGESAGSFAVNAQMASPMAKATLAHAIGESGGAFSRTGMPFPALDVTERRDEKFAREVWGKSSLAELRAVPADELQRAAMKSGPGGASFEPVVDGYFLPKSVPDIFAAGEQAHIPLLVGWNHDEQIWAVLGMKQPITVASYAEFATQLYGPAAAEFLKVYPGSSDAEARRSLIDYESDQFISASTWEWAEAQGKTGGAPVYRYRFDRPSPGDAFHPVQGGAFHADEIEYVFGVLGSRKDAAWKAEDYELSKLMQRYWINFATNGDPNGPGLPLWPAYDAKTGNEVMHLDRDSHALPDTMRERYLFLRHTPPMKAGQ